MRCDHSMRYLTAFLVVVGVTLTGCGGDDDSGSESPRTVTAGDINQYRDGSPGWVTLAWWRDVQFRNAEGALSLYAGSEAPSQEDFVRQVSYAASSFVGVPEIVDVRRSGSLATVYMTVQPPGSDSPPRPLSLNLTEADNDWLLRDNDLMDAQVARVARAREAAAG
jgi:hypothetical protein